VKRLGYGLADRGIAVRFLAGERNLSLLRNVQIGPWAHPASYSMNEGGPFPEVKGGRQ